LSLRGINLLIRLDTGASGKNNKNKNKIKESPKKGEGEGEGISVHTENIIN